jgi:exonuclease SbcC
MTRKTVKEQTNLLDLLSKVSLAPEGAGPALRDHTRPVLARDQFQLDRLDIENLWSYKKAFLQFEPGITVIAGANGSGKSSLLESIFFALYGSEARHVIGRSLEEILRIGADSGSVKLSFFHSGQRYMAQIALRRQGATAKSERSGCQLTCDDGTAWVGTENVIAEIERLFGMDREGFANCVYVRQGEIDRLIRADRRTREQMLDGLLGLYKIDLFVNPRSKEALRALNRKADFIDGRLTRLRQETDVLEREELGKQKAQLTEQMELVQGELKTVDEHRTDAYKLLQSYDDSLRHFAQATAELHQIDQELSDKQSRLAQREVERKEFESELERLSGRHQKSVLALKTSLREMDSARILESLDHATAFEEVALLPIKLSECKVQIEQQRARLQEAREQVARLMAERAQRERTVAQLREQYDDLARVGAREDDQIKKIERELAALEEGQAKHEKTLITRLGEIAEQACQLGATLSTTTLQDSTAPTVAKIKSAWARELKALEEQYDQTKLAVLQTKTQCEALRQELTQKQGLLIEGRCPTCGQSVPHDHLTEALEQIAPRIAEFEGSVQHEERELARIEEKLALWKQIQTVLDELGLEVERLETRRAEVAIKRGALEEARQRRRALQDRLVQSERQITEEAHIATAQHAEHENVEKAVQVVSSALNQSLDNHEQFEKMKSEIENLLRLREQWREKQTARKTLLESLNELRGDIARLQDRHRQVQDRLKGQSGIESKRAQVQELLGELDKQRTTVQERYDQLAQARGVVQGRVEHLKRLQNEMTQAVREQEAMTTLKAELDEIVSVYQTTKVELRKRNLEALNYYFNEFFSLMDSGDSYSRVTVRDDYEIEVELKNGRTLNPSLMSGGERALTNIALRCAIHQVLAKAVRRMPLILDEPTIYLDRDRVHRLQFLLEDLGKRVGQVIVVSHEVGLVEGADHEYRTEKGSDNISIIYKVR